MTMPIYSRELGQMNYSDLAGTVGRLEAQLRYLQEQSDFEISRLKKKITKLEERIAALGG